MRMGQLPGSSRGFTVMTRRELLLLLLLRVSAGGLGR
jgi:hypothetical protein